MRNLLTTASLFLFIYFLPAVSLCQFNNSELPFSINEDGAAPDSSAILDLQSAKKGLLMPRLAFSDILNISQPAEGLLVYDTDTKCVRIYISGNWECLCSKQVGNGASLPISGWSNNPLDEGWDTSIGVDSQDNVYTTSTTEDQEIRLIKYDSDGNYQWDIFERAQEMSNINIDQNDNVFTVGSFRSSHSPFDFNGTLIPGGPYPGGRFIAKTTADGLSTDLVYIDSGSDNVGSSMDENGNLTVAYINGSSLRVKRFDNNLNEIWSNSISLSTTSPWLGISDLILDPIGNVYVSGYHNNGLGSPNPANDPLGVHNIYVVKFANANGASQWYRSFIISSAPQYPTKLYYLQNRLVTLTSDAGQFYDRKYNLPNGTNASTMTISRSIGLRDIADYGSSSEIALSATENVNGVVERKILFYNPTTSNFTSSKILDFYPGLIEYNQSGTTLFGVGEGTQINGVIVNQGPDPTLVFKIQTN